jgi:cytochrome c biogenesis protein CcdA
MGKRAILFVLVGVGASALYDFNRGYHETRSIFGGVVWVVLGLVVLAIFWWLYSQGSNSN